MSRFMVRRRDFLRMAGATFGTATLSTVTLGSMLTTSAHAVGGPDAISFNTIGYPQGLTTLTSSWGQIQEVASDRIQLTTTPQYKNNAYAMRIMVEPGDVGPWHTGERAEVSAMKVGNNYILETEASGTQYLAYSIYVPKTWQPPEVDPACSCTWGTPFQLHGPDLFGASPTMALSLLDKYTFSINAGNLDVLGKYHGVPIAFADGGQIAFDTWQDFIIKVVFSKSDNGAVTIWRRVIGDKEFKTVIDIQNIETLQSMPSVEATSAWQQGYGGGIHEYWKQGFYRSTSPNLTSVLYHSGLVRAGSFAAAEFAAFGTNDGSGNPGQS